MTFAFTAMKHGAILAAFAIAAAFGADAPYNSGAPSDAYQLGVASNLNIGDSIINLANAGINGVGNPTSSNSICVNTYVFTPDATMVACCSTRLPANALQSYSVRSDLISNTNTPGVPNTVLIKFVATDPVDPSCTNSAGVAGTLVGGLFVAATTVHAAPTTPVTYVPTNSPFQTKILGIGEYKKLTSQCNAIIQSGPAGICRSSH